MPPSEIDMILSHLPVGAGDIAGGSERLRISRIRRLPPRKAAVGGRKRRPWKLLYVQCLSWGPLTTEQETKPLSGQGFAERRLDSRLRLPISKGSQRKAGMESERHKDYADKANFIASETI